MDNPTRSRYSTTLAFFPELISDLLPIPTADQQLVLCVEDSDADFCLIQMALQEVSPAVRTYRALDGEHAIEFLDHFGKSKNGMRPALILLDGETPRKNGFEVLEYIKIQAEMCSIPRVMLSSSVDPREKRRALALGAAEFITKPLDLDPFIDEVRDLCSRHLQASPVAA